MKIDIPAALHELGMAVDHLAELLEWEKLAQQERRPHRPPAFQLPDHHRKDIVDAYGAFIDLDMRIREALGTADGDRSSADVVNWLSLIHELEARIDGLGIRDRFIKL